MLCNVIPERFRGELLTMGRYTNLAFFIFFSFSTMTTSHKHNGEFTYINLKKQH